MLSKNYLKSLKQRVALNDFSSYWKKRGFTGIVAGITYLSCIYKGLIAYINDIPHDIASIYKMFFDDTSLFSKILSLSDLNFDLKTTNQWAHQWKMLFNPDTNK